MEGEMELFTETCVVVPSEEDVRIGERPFSAQSSLSHSSFEREDDSVSQISTNSSSKASSRQPSLSQENTSFDFLEGHEKLVPEIDESPDSVVQNKEITNRWSAESQRTASATSSSKASQNTESTEPRISPTDSMTMTAKVDPPPTAKASSSLSPCQDAGISKSSSTMPGVSSTSASERPAPPSLTMPGVGSTSASERPAPPSPTMTTRSPRREAEALGSVSLDACGMSRQTTGSGAEAAAVTPILVPTSAGAPSETETDWGLTTLQLVLRAREIGAARQREKEALLAAKREDVESADSGYEAVPRCKLRLPHLREPTKEPEPTDPDFTVRLGAFMERFNDDGLQRLLQKEFPEEERIKPRPPERTHPSFLTPISPATSFSPLPPATRAEVRRIPAVPGVRTPGSVKGGKRHQAHHHGLKSNDQFLAPVSGQFRTESESSLARFRRIAQTVKIGTRVGTALKSLVERSDVSGWSFVETYLHMQQGMGQQLAFNVHSFAKTQQLNGGPRLEKLLSIPQQHRTAKTVQQILSLVRCHNGFSDFPPHVQLLLCRVMRYEKYESRRILLRQGHQPTGFYLLLTGSLMVNIQDVHPSTGHVFIRTVSDLKEGDCFGELALLEQSPRTATIICKTAVELLSVSREDFDRIVRLPLLQQRDDVISMCKKHLLFEDFPVDVFYDNPEGFFFQYCPAGMVVVKNGQKCAYLVFVKSGKCHLVNSYNSSELTRKRIKSASRDMQRAFPLYTEVMKISSVRRKRPNTHPEGNNSHDNMMMDVVTQVLGIRHSQMAAQAKRDLGVRTQELAAPPPPPLQKSRTLTNFYDKLQKERRQKLIKSSDPGTEALASFWSQRLVGPVLDKASRTPRAKADRQLPSSSGQHVRSLDFLRPDKEGFAQIAELAEGDVFGLETLIRRQAGRVSVVSDGAELIFISKKLFLQHANIKVLRIVHDMSMTYPSAVSIHDMLRFQRDWTRYRRALVRHVVTRVGRTYLPPCQLAA